MRIFLKALYNKFKMLTKAPVNLKLSSTVTSTTTISSKLSENVPATSTTIVSSSISTTVLEKISNLNIGESSLTGKSTVSTTQLVTSPLQPHTTTLIPATSAGNTILLPRNDLFEESPPKNKKKFVNVRYVDRKLILRLTYLDICRKFTSQSMSINVVTAPSLAQL